MTGSTCDLIVIGGGPAGHSGAAAAALFGKRVRIVERSGALGGAGTNTGTIPSKTLRESALLLSGARSRELLGVEVTQKREAKLADFVHHERRVSAAMREQMEHRCVELGIETVYGSASFVDAHTVEVATLAGPLVRLAADKILIATGSTPVRPPEFPFEHPRVHDSDEILEIVEIPRVLAVIGAGVIGVEYACTFAALGVEVHLVDGRAALLPFLDEEISHALHRAMEASGIRFHLEEKVERCLVRGADEVVLTLSSGAELVASDVLVAAGRRCETAKLALERAGLAVGERGAIAVDEQFRTVVPSIYAAGDVVGPPSLAATGMEQARIAVTHAFGLLDKRPAKLLPTGIYSIPEASQVGESEQALRARGVDVIVGRARYATSARGRIAGDTSGFLKLVFRREDLRLLGVHVLGEQATELVHIGLIAMIKEADAWLFSEAAFNYPTLGELYKIAGYDAILQKLRAANARPV